MLTYVSRVCRGARFSLSPTVVGVLSRSLASSGSSKAMDLNAYHLKSMATAQPATLGNLCKDNACVVIFFRRWGCVFCRMWAKEVSEISKTLTQNNVKLIGIGAEDIGAEEFKEGKFFDGDLYLSDKDAYKNLGFKRFSYINVAMSMIWTQTRNAISKSKTMNVSGDLKGDGLQNGGALIVGKDGKILKHFIQDGPADHISNEDILKILNIEVPPTNAEK
ncbi:prostamide/prostaglandin F synthase-like [Arctopsyche grandis]|uniref:prostamide/prostaglandin F synthase-like n=1 Tax=Arctopsyche grandis TaxID=121162 RepID=UPI00406D98DB